MEELSELTVVQLLEEHNRLVDQEQRLKGWKGGKEELVAKVMELREAHRKRQSGRTIKSAAYELLLKTDYLDHTQRPVGYSYDLILEKLRDEFPDSSTTDKCLRWYAVQLNLDNARMPWRPRRAPKKKVKADAA
jgi:hypothetical protein